MSYSSENILPAAVKQRDVREFVELLGYEKTGTWKTKELGPIEEYWFFEEADYQSWSGVELSIHKNEEEHLVVTTRSTVGRSYYDLTQQNITISSLRKRFGGSFITDEGRGRYLRPSDGAPPPPASGCYLAFNRFGGNLIKAKKYHDAREFPKKPFGAVKGQPSWMQELDPRTLANNLLMPFLVASIEDYFKSTFIALLRYSPKKEKFFKGVRIQGEQLVSISDGSSTVEAQIAEWLPFQRLSAVCRHFAQLDPKLDIAGSLRKPYRRRKTSLYDSIDGLVLSRHDFIHRTTLDLSMTDERMDDFIYDLDVAITRVYRRITKHYGWFFDRGWYLGRRPARKKKAAKKK